MFLLGTGVGVVYDPIPTFNPQRSRPSRYVQKTFLGEARTTRTHGIWRKLALI